MLERKNLIDFRNYFWFDNYSQVNFYDQYLVFIRQNIKLEYVKAKKYGLRFLNIVLVPMVTKITDFSLLHQLDFVSVLFRLYPRVVLAWRRVWLSLAWRRRFYKRLKSRKVRKTGGIDFQLSEDSYYVVGSLLSYHMMIRLFFFNFYWFFLSFFKKNFLINYGKSHTFTFFFEELYMYLLEMLNITDGISLQITFGSLFNDQYLFRENTFFWCYFNFHLLVPSYAK